MSINKAFSGIIELLEAFPDEKTCVRYLETLLWNGSPVSPFDSTSKVYVCKGGRYRCKNTRKYFNVKTRTIFEGSKIGLQKWFTAIYMIVSRKSGISAYTLAIDLRVTHKTAWFLLHRLRRAMVHDSFDQILKGIIEMDETLIGGRNPNRHKDKKVKGCQGRSYKDKTPVLGMLERAIYEVKERPHKRNPAKTVREKILIKKGRVKCFVLHNTTADILDPIIIDHVEKDSKVYTDEYNGYNNVCMNYKHGVVNHSYGLYVKGEIYSNGIENFWTNVKNSVRGTYVDIRGKYLQSYFNEFTFRRNFHTEQVDNKFRYLLESIKGKRLTYKALTAKAA